MFLYGASGHAKVILDILAANGVDVEAIVDDNTDASNLHGIPIIHSADGCSPMIISIGNCEVRKRIAERLSCEFGRAVHPSAVISPSAKVEAGTVVMQGAIIQADAYVGHHCIINTRASVDHECHIGNYVHIAPGCTLSGNVKVGSGTWIGVGSTVIQGIRIGRNCMIGAGSVIVRDLPDNVVAYGCPCRVIKNR